MKKKRKKKNFNMTYEETHVLSLTIHSMYLGGPKFRDVKKSLSHKKQAILYSFATRVEAYLKKPRNGIPDCVQHPTTKMKCGRCCR